MIQRYAAMRKTDRCVLSSPTELHDPRTDRLACSIWSWVPDPDGIKAHHFDSRADAKAVLRNMGADLSKVSFHRVG